MDALKGVFPYKLALALKLWSVETEFLKISSCQSVSDNILPSTSGVAGLSIAVELGSSIPNKSERPFIPFVDDTPE
jgi:hypothetical protein